MVDPDKEGKKAIKIVLLGEQHLIEKISFRFINNSSICKTFASYGEEGYILETYIIIEKKKYDLYMENVFPNKGLLECEIKTEDPDAICFAYDIDNDYSFKILKNKSINEIKNRYPNALLTLLANNLTKSKNNEQIQNDFIELDPEKVASSSQEINIDDYEGLEILFGEMIYKILNIDEPYKIEKKLQDNESIIPDNLDAPATAFVKKSIKGKKSFLRECCDSCLIV